MFRISKTLDTGVCMYILAIHMEVSIHMANTDSKLNRKPVSKMLIERDSWTEWEWKRLKFSFTASVVFDLVSVGYKIAIIAKH